MKRISVVFVALFVAMSFVGAANAHLPPGTTFFVFQWPDDRLPNIDGDISEWDIVPEVYWVTADEMFNQFGAAMDLSDFNSKYAWGWNATTNMLYFGGWIYDDMRHGTEHWSIEVDANHTGAQYRDVEGWTEEEKKRWQNAVAQKYDYAYPEDPKGYILRTANASTWSVEPPYAEWGARVVSGIPNDFETPDVIEQELAITPWEDLNWVGPEVSKIVPLTENRILGIEVNTGDKDADPGAYDDAYWSTCGGVNAWKFADQFGDFLLAPIEPGLFPGPTPVRDLTWGRIKTTFVR